MRVALRWLLISAAYVYASIAVAIGLIAYRSGWHDLSASAWCGATWPVWVGRYL